MNVIYGNISFLHSDIADHTQDISRSEYNTKVNDAFNAVSSVSLILNDIVLYDNILSGDFRISCEYLHAGDLMHKFASRFAYLGKHKNTSVTLNNLFPCLDQNGSLFVDEKKIGNTLHFFLANVIDSAPSNSEIKLTLSKSSEYVGQSIDSGVANLCWLCITITAPCQLDLTSPRENSGERSFDMRTLRNNGSFNLGYSISRRVISEHDAFIRVGHSKVLGEDVTTINLTFQLYDTVAITNIPVLSLESTAPPIISASAIKVHPIDNVIEATPKSASIKVLIVDDSSVCRRTLSEMVSRCIKSLKLGINLEITLADDGDDAVETVTKTLKSNEYYTIIFMDFIMKRMNGPDATKIIRSLGYTGHLIAVTGNVLSVDINTFIAAGANAVLEKPVTKEEMMFALKAILPVF